jgi:TPP-dependent 2-oxoacid decarboxylase
LGVGWGPPGYAVPAITGAACARATSLTKKSRFRRYRRNLMLGNGLGHAAGVDVQRIVLLSTRLDALGVGWGPPGYAVPAITGAACARAISLTKKSRFRRYRRNLMLGFAVDLYLLSC